LLLPNVPKLPEPETPDTGLDCSSGEDNQPLPVPLEVLLAFVVKTNQEAKDEGELSSEWATVGKGRGGNDGEVEKETG